MVNGAVAFVDTVIIETGLLELAVYVGGEYEIAAGFFFAPV